MNKLKEIWRSSRIWWRRRILNEATLDIKSVTGHLTSIEIDATYLDDPEITEPLSPEYLRGIPNVEIEIVGFWKEGDARAELGN